MDLASILKGKFKVGKSFSLKKFFNDRPDILLIILLIGVTIYATIYLYLHGQQKIKDASQSINAFEEKAKIVESFKIVEKDYEEIKKKFSQSISVDQFVAKLSEMAVTQNVQTVALNPIQKVDSGYFNITIININVSSDKHENLIAFVSQIEKSQYPLRIENFSESIKSADSIRSKDSEGKTFLEASIDIGLVELKK